MPAFQRTYVPAATAIAVGIAGGIAGLMLWNGPLRQHLSGQSRQTSTQLAGGDAAASFHEDSPLAPSTGDVPAENHTSLEFASHSAVVAAADAYTAEPQPLTMTRDNPVALEPLGEPPFVPAATTEDTTERPSRTEADVSSESSLMEPAALPKSLESSPPLSSSSRSSNLPAVTPAANQPDVQDDRKSVTKDDASKSPRTPQPPSIIRADLTELVADLANADPHRVAAVERELKRRGLSDMELEIARQSGNPEPAARIRLAYALPSLPGINAQPWLLQLTRDPNPQVRFAAITVLATSTDPTLIEQIAEAARKDIDPEVRAQASELLRKRGVR